MRIFEDEKTALNRALQKNKKLVRQLAQLVQQIDSNSKAAKEIGNDINELKIQYDKLNTEYKQPKLTEVDKQHNEAIIKLAVAKAEVLRHADDYKERLKNLQKKSEGLQENPELTSKHVEEINKQAEKALLTIKKTHRPLHVAMPYCNVLRFRYDFLMTSVKSLNDMNTFFKAAQPTLDNKIIHSISIRKSETLSNSDSFEDLLTCFKAGPGIKRKEGRGIKPEEEKTYELVLRYYLHLCRIDLHVTRIIRAYQAFVDGKKGRTTNRVETTIKLMEDLTWHLCEFDKCQIELEKKFTEGNLEIMSAEPTDDQKEHIKTGGLLVIITENDDYYLGFWHRQDNEYKKKSINDQEAIKWLKACKNGQAENVELIRKIHNINTLYGGRTHLSLPDSTAFRNALTQKEIGLNNFVMKEINPELFHAREEEEKKLELEKQRQQEQEEREKQEQEEFLESKQNELKELKTEIRELEIEIDELKSGLVGPPAAPELQSSTQKYDDEGELDKVCHDLEQQKQYKAQLLKAKEEAPLKALKKEISNLKERVAELEIGLDPIPVMPGISLSTHKVINISALLEYDRSLEGRIDEATRRVEQLERHVEKLKAASRKKKKAEHVLETVVKKYDTTKNRKTYGKDKSFSCLKHIVPRNKGRNDQVEFLRYVAKAEVKERDVLTYAALLVVKQTIEKENPRFTSVLWCICNNLASKKPKNMKKRTNIDAMRQLRKFWSSTTATDKPEMKKWDAEEAIGHSIMSLH